jgi:hypothetical protein
MLPKMLEDDRRRAGWRVGRAVVQRQQDDGSVHVVAYRFGESSGRVVVPRGALRGDDPSNN